MLLSILLRISLQSQSVNVTQAYPIASVTSVGSETCSSRSSLFLLGVTFRIQSEESILVRLRYSTSAIAVKVLAAIAVSLTQNGVRKMLAVTHVWLQSRAWFISITLLYGGE